MHRCLAHLNVDAEGRFEGVLQDYGHVLPAAHFAVLKRVREVHRETPCNGAVTDHMVNGAAARNDDGAAYNAAQYRGKNGVRLFRASKADLQTR